jgi:hypothetical protein
MISFRFDDKNIDSVLARVRLASIGNNIDNRKTAAIPNYRAHHYLWLTNVARPFCQDMSH